MPADPLLAQGILEEPGYAKLRARKPENHPFCNSDRKSIPGDAWEQDNKLRFLFQLPGETGEGHPFFSAH